MWMTESIWFEIAIVNIVFAVGNIFFGHFEAHTPKAKRFGKYVLVLMIVIGLSVFLGRAYALGFLVLCFLPAIYIHTVFLPRKGINGWTGEPLEKYYEFRGWDQKKVHRPDRQEANPEEDSK